ncbi:uncharacterized protein ACR2FA_001224 [Aphomia sociella]
MNIYGQIESSLQQLYDRLATLENAITFSHLNRLHPSIIDPSYLILELASIQNEIDLNIPYSPNLRNIHLLEKTITVKAYSTNETLNFVLEIPLTTTHPYYLLHLYSIPNNNNMILIPSNPYLILGSDEFAYPHEPCLKITDDESICKHLEWQALQHSEDCIAQLIQHQQPHNCTYATANYDKNIIQQIQENSWIVIMKQEEVIKTTCGDDVQYQRAIGVSLVTINNKCIIEVMGRTLQTHKRYVNIKESIPLPRAYGTPETSNLQVDLEEIELDNLKNAIQRSKELLTDNDDIPFVSTKPSWISISLYIIFITTVSSLFIYKYWWRRRSALQADLQQDVEVPLRPLQQPSVRLSVKGEELHYRNGHNHRKIPCTQNTNSQSNGNVLVFVIV